MALTALKMGAQLIRHAPKLQKAAKLTSFQKIIRGVKSSTKVIQQKLKTKQNLAKVSEKIGDIRNNVGRMGQIRSMAKAVNSSTGVLRSTANAQRTAKLNNMLRNNYMGGMGPKDMLRNLVKAKPGFMGLGKLGPALRFTGPVLTIWEANEARKKVFNPKDNITHSIRNLATSIKHVGDQKTYKRTRLVGDNPLTQMHNKRVDALTKLDAREARNKEKSDAK